jgi:hypothetical protein
MGKETFMIRSIARFCWGMIIALTTAVLPLTANAVPYNFVRVADSTTIDVGSLPDAGFSGHYLQFDLNNSGTMVFGTVLPSGQTRIYTGNGGPLSLVAADDPAAGVVLQPESVSINDFNVVSYMRQSNPDDIRGIYRSDGTTIYEAALSGPRPPERPTAINNSGQVAFFVPNYRAGVNAVLRGDGATLVEIAATDLNGFDSISPVATSINSAGTVAFVANVSPMTSYEHGGVYAGSGGALNPIDPNPDEDRILGPTAINNAGSVAFTKVIGSNGIISIGDGGPLSQYNFPPNISAIWLSMNDLGDVAWFGNNTLYVGQNPVTGKVIDVGAPLDGSTVAFLGLPRLNNIGQIGFPAQLSDGRMGLYIATSLLRGDFNRDGHVDAADILPMEQALTNLSDYKATYAPGITDPQLAFIEDVNQDGSFNNADLQFLLDTLKSGGGSADSVPEPASIALLGIGALAIVFRRRSR